MRKKRQGPAYKPRKVEGLEMEVRKYRLWAFLLSEYPKEWPWSRLFKEFHWGKECTQRCLDSLESEGKVYRRTIGYGMFKEKHFYRYRWRGVNKDKGWKGDWNEILETDCP